MKLNVLLEIVHRAYPDEMTRECWDSRRQRARSGSGDTLAEFIVREITDTYAAEATDEAQLDEAMRVMRRACTEVTGVIDALEERKDANARAG